MDPRHRLVFALDVDDAGKALDLVARLEGEVGVFKIGLELFVRTALEGRDLVSEVASRGRVFLDLKLHDIPATMRGALRSAATRGNIEYLTMHAQGGTEALRESLRHAGSIKVLGVTVLTSIAPASLPSLGYSAGVEDLVLMRARSAMEAGCAGIVCSGHEARRVREALGPSATLVVPGIRPVWDGAGAQDQKRIMTPADAIMAGADLIVVGRPIRDAADPCIAARRIVEEIASACASPSSSKPAAR